MAKNSVFDWDATAANNTDVGGFGITGNSLPSNLDDAMRTLMAQVKAFQTYLGITATGNIWDKAQTIAVAASVGLTIERTNNTVNALIAFKTTSGTTVAAGQAQNSVFGVGDLASMNTPWLTVSASGVTFSGVLSGNGSGLTGMSSAQVVPPGRDSIGAYGLLRNVSGASVTSGSTVAGADLRYISIQNPGATGASPPGTWRNHSNTLANSESGLFVRIA